MNKHSILIVDDHRLFREGLKLLLENLSFTGEIEEAENGLECLLKLEKHYFDIVFMDVDMPVMNGIEACRKALSQFPGLNIIALSMHAEESYYKSMITAGAKGFILKNSGIQDIEDAMQQVMSGRNYFSQEILSEILRSINRSKKNYTPGELSEREEEVLYHICKGLANHEIAKKLNISKRTVDKHRENLLLKTASRNTAGLVIYAIKNNIIEV